MKGKKENDVRFLKFPCGLIMSNFLKKRKKIFPKKNRSVYRETMLMFIDSDGLTYGLSIKYRSGQFLKSFSIFNYKT